MIPLRSTLLFFALVTLLSLPLAARAEHLPEGRCMLEAMVLASIQAERPDVPYQKAVLTGEEAAYVLGRYNSEEPRTDYKADRILLVTSPAMVVQGPDGKPMPFLIVVFFLDGCATGQHDRMPVLAVASWLSEMRGEGA